jgi:hydroxymethylpyrimidine/phosphomethylpyrimidine kinase
MTAIALTIAGSDPSGGAGIQADLKTFHQHGVFGTSVVTLLTAQNTVGVQAIEFLSPAFILTQIDSVVADVPPSAAKTGALGTREVVEAVADRARAFTFPLVVDPVMVSKHGHALCDDAASEAIQRRLLPQAFLVTPNLAEAERLAEMRISDRAAMEKAAWRIAERGPRHVLIKAGHRTDDPVDFLLAEGVGEFLPVERVESRSTHGTGCTLSAAIAALLAQGADIRFAVSSARSFVRTAIVTARPIGKGCGPVNHFVTVSVPKERTARSQLPRFSSGDRP